MRLYMCASASAPVCHCTMGRISKWKNFMGGTFSKKLNGFITISRYPGEASRRKIIAAKFSICDKLIDNRLKHVTN